MNKKQVIEAIKNCNNNHDRERLNQLLHYMTVEGVESTTTTNNNNRTRSTQHTKNNKRNNNKRNTSKP